MTLFQYHLLGLALASLAMFGFGVFAFLKNSRSPLNRAMALYCLSIAWWSGWECAALQMPTPAQAFLLMRIEYLGVVFIPSLLCCTVTHLVHIAPAIRRKLLAFLYGLSVITLIPATIVPTRQFVWVTDRPVAYLPIWVQAGPYYWLFMAFFFGTILMAHAMAFYRWRRSSGDERARLMLFSIGSTFAYFGGCPEFALKYEVRLGWLSPFGLYVFPFYIALLTYAVVQYRFLDISIVIRKSLVYSMLVTILTVSYFGLVYGIEQIVQAALGYQSPVVSLAAFAIMALVFQPLKIGIQRAVDHLVFRAPQHALARRLELLERELRDADKAKAVSRLATGIAHEIKNPLTALKTYLDFLPERGEDPQFRRQFRQVVGQEMVRLQELAKGLLDFARPAVPQRANLDLHAIVDQVAELTRPHLLERGITLECQYGHNGAQLVGDAGELSQALLNLVLNARDAMARSGVLTIATRTIATGVEIVIADTGQGIPAADLPRLFEPFFTKKPHGTGLGLSIVQRIIQDHGGTIAVASAPGQGTSFTIKLPAHNLT